MNKSIGILLLIGWVIFLIFEILRHMAFAFFIAVLVCGIIYGIYQLFVSQYFSSQKFLDLKKTIERSIQDCNALNSHIEELKYSYMFYKKRIDLGVSSFTDNSSWNFRRVELSKYKEANNIYNCSRQVCANARIQPFKYICKYFNIDCNESTLAFYEDLVNKFSAVEQGQKSYISERDLLIESIYKKIPRLIRYFSMNRLYRELGIKPFSIKDRYYPSYQFLYISSGGNSSLECTIDFDISTLEKFVYYIASVIEKKNSIVGQRLLMTRELREQIKKRDGYKCVKCGVSLKDEPHLLLEIDHIIPVSKGGKTIPENLQTLCWRCNRSKSNKLIDNN